MTTIRFMRSFVLPVLLFFVFALLPRGSHAAFHLFRINEIYSSADGTIQFIEIKESTGSDFESFWQGQRLRSTQGLSVRRDHSRHRRRSS